MNYKKKFSLCLSSMLLLTILLMPTIVWQFTPSVETCTVISLTKEGAILPKSVVQQGNNPCVFLLVSEKGIWNDGFVVQRIDVKVIKSDDDSVMVTDAFHPSQELVILGKHNLYDGIHVRRF